MDTERVLAKYRKSGQKITPQRLAVLGALQGDRTHPTAATVVEKVHRDHPYVSPATVYRVLNELASMGEVEPLSLDKETVRYDPNTDGHAHLLCDRCGRVDDASWAMTPDMLSASLSMGYRLKSVQVVLRGTCPQCQESSPKEDGSL